MEKDKNKPEKKSDDKLYRKGIKVGASGAALGTLLAGVGHLEEKGKEWIFGPNDSKKDEHLKQAKGMKYVGIPLALASASLAGYSAYKHHKYKENRDNKEGEGDDNSKK